MATVDAAFCRVFAKGALGIHIPNGDIGSISASTLVSVRWLRNTAWDSLYFKTRNAIIYRPESASLPADEIRYAGALTSSTGTLAPSENWADSTLGTEDFFIFDNAVHPQYVLDALSRALEKAYFQNIEPLSTKPSVPSAVVADAGFQSTATTSYTAVSTTFTKHTTANSRSVFQGMASGSVANSGANGHIYQRFDVNPGETMYVHAISRLDSGTAATLVMQDVTNTAAIGSTLSHTLGAFQYMRRQETVPEDCSLVEVRLGGSGTSDQTYWGGFCFYVASNLRIHLDTKWDTQFKATKLVAARMGGQNQGNDIWPAHAGDYIEIPDDDYDFLFERPGPNPYAIQFHTDRWFQYPIFIQGRRAQSDITGTLTSASWATDVAVDLDLWDALARVELFSDSRVQQKIPDWQNRLAQAERDLRRATPQFVMEGPAAASPGYVFRGAPN